MAFSIYQYLARDIWEFKQLGPEHLAQVDESGHWTFNQNQLLASRHTQQIYDYDYYFDYDHFELLFCFEELIDSSNDYWGEQPALEQG